MTPRLPPFPDAEALPVAAVDPPPAPPAPEPDTIRLIDADGSQRPRSLITALGPDLPGREALVLQVAARVTAQGRRPVICATHLTLPFLTDAPVAIELLPTRADLPVLTTPEYSAYLRQRHLVLMAKWDVTEEITLGEAFEEFLARETAEIAG